MISLWLSVLIAFVFNGSFIWAASINDGNSHKLVWSGPTHPSNMEVIDEPSYWELYRTLHMPGDDPVLSNEEVLESLRKLNAYTDKLQIDTMQRSYINQRIKSLIELSLEDPKNCDMSFTLQLTRTQEYNQDYTRHLVPYMQKMEDRQLDSCRQQVTNEVDSLQRKDEASRNLETFKEFLTDVLEASPIDSENPLISRLTNLHSQEEPESEPKTEVQIKVNLDRQYDYIPHSMVVNGLIDYLLRYYKPETISTREDLENQFKTNLTGIMKACQVIMQSGEPILSEFDAIYEADPVKVNSFDETTLEFITGLRVCEHLKYINSEIMHYLELFQERAKITIANHLQFNINGVSSKHRSSSGSLSKSDSSNGRPSKRQKLK